MNSIMAGQSGAVKRVLEFRLQPAPLEINRLVSEIFTRAVKRRRLKA